MHTLGVDAAERRRSNNSGMKVEADIMRFGVTVGNMNGFNDESGPNACIDVAQAAEDLGFDSVWTNDHIVVPTQIESRYPYNDLGEFPAPSTIQCFEPLAVMCALAEATQSVEIGCSVLVIPYRHPAVVAKMLAAADQISGGRIVLGAGVGWMREEFEALGLPEVNYRRRGAVTNEYLRAMREIWTNPGPCSFHGQFVEFENVGAYPKPIQARGWRHDSDRDRRQWDQRLASCIALWRRLPRGFSDSREHGGRGRRRAPSLRARPSRSRRAGNPAVAGDASVHDAAESGRSAVAAWLARPDRV